LAAKEKLGNNRPLLDKIADLLLDKETLDEKEFRALMQENAA